MPKKIYSAFLPILEITALKDILVSVDQLENLLLNDNIKPQHKLINLRAIALNLVKDGELG